MNQFQIELVVYKILSPLFVFFIIVIGCLEKKGIICSKKKNSVIMKMSLFIKMTQTMKMKHMKKEEATMMLQQLIPHISMQMI